MFCKVSCNGSVSIGPYIAHMLVHANMQLIFCLSHILHFTFNAFYAIDHIFAIAAKSFNSVVPSPS